ncbi:hypothetical protein F5887DRAFT_1010587 [Amanita rubescens]|nr:hypothetical protein F5887DRAFT_1018290 [Amanita rubescens]KAF8327654.1 hypothetical protein F5887DRAFT_1010587 [Amanita rubescens]
MTQSLHIFVQLAPFLHHLLQSVPYCVFLAHAQHHIRSWKYTAMRPISSRAGPMPTIPGLSVRFELNILSDAKTQSTSSLPDVRATMVRCEGCMAQPWDRMASDSHMHNHEDHPDHYHI